MKSKSTTLWFMLAVLLGTAIWILDKYFQPATSGEQPLFAGLLPDQVATVQVSPGTGREISAVRTNKTWLLEKPVAYPAQPAAIEGLLGALEKLTPTISLSAGELNGRKNADAEFGFDNPQFRLDVAAGEKNWHLLVGNKTAPGDGVYVRVAGASDAYVTGTTWLQFLPHDANAWRDTALVDMPALVDWLVITNGAQAIELRRDVTNRLWRIIRPYPSRANNLLIVSALQQLHTASITKFVNDDAKPDLTAYGLQPASLDIWLGTGTNLLTAIHVGKDAGTAGEVYARREGWNAIVATPKEALTPWRGQVIDFRDPNLLELTAPVAEVEVLGISNFMLEAGTNGWTVAGEKFPVDEGQVTAFVRKLAGLPIAAFAQDAVTAAGLKGFGLAPPARQITLRSKAGDTNAVIAQLLFGAFNTNTDTMYVKRGDEDYVYSLALSKLDQLLLTGDNYRQLRVWNFSETNVTQVTLRQGARTRQMLRTGTNAWSLTAGSGIINPLAVEEAVHRLGQLTAFGWIGRKFNDAEMGLSTNSPSITIELKSGEKYAIDFGRDVYVPDQTALAMVTLDGERWALVFPPVLYPVVAESLTIPPDAPTLPAPTPGP